MNQVACLPESAINTETVYSPPAPLITDIAIRRNIREMVQVAESHMQTSERATEIPVNHHFADGLYGREMFLPAGSIISSKIHKVNHFVFVMMGSAYVIDDNAGPQLVEAPRMLMTRAGTKRIIKALDDFVWITVHATEETNVDEIERQVLSETYLDDLGAGA